MVYILLAEGFEEMEALVPADLLRRAGVEVALVGLDAPTISGGHGIAVSTDLLLEQVRLQPSDMLVLPGGMGGVTNLQNSPAAMALIQEAHDLKCWLAAICAAPTLLGRLGLLDDRSAVCYPGMEDQLGRACAQPERHVVVDGRVITSRAAGSAFEFGFTLVELLTNSTKAEEIRNGIHYCTGKDSAAC